jgi:hypothetical protein
MYADDIDFQAVVKRSDVMDSSLAVFVATVMDEMNAHGRQSAVREGLVVLVTTQMSLYTLERYPRQDFKMMNHYRSNLHRSQTARLFLNHF